MVRDARLDPSQCQNARLQNAGEDENRLLHTDGAQAGHGQRQAEDREVPFMQDLIFVHEVQAVIDPIVENVHTFQYRFLKQRKPMTVRNADMERFIQAVESSENPKFYRPSEITPDMLSRKIRIIGGQLDGYEGTLLTLRGSKVKRLLVELPTLLAAAVEVQPEFIRLID